MDFSFLWTWIVDVAVWLLDLIKSLFEVVWKLLTDVVCWCFDKFLGLAVSILGSFDTSALGSWSSAAGSLGSEILNILGLLGVHYALGIILSAIVIRILLQLIPFTRLGS